MTSNTIGFSGGGAGIVAPQVPMEFPSLFDPVFTITSTGANQALPSVTVDLPAGAVIFRAVAQLKYVLRDNTNAAANSIAIDAAEHIQIQKNGASAWTDCIALVNGMAQAAAGAREGGDVWQGTIDISALIIANGDGQYDFRFEDSDAEHNNLILRDVQMVITIWWGL